MARSRIRKLVLRYRVSGVFTAWGLGLSLRAKVAGTVHAYTALGFEGAHGFRMPLKECQRLSSPASLGARRRKLWDAIGCAVLWTKNCVDLKKCLNHSSEAEWRA